MNRMKQRNKRLSLTILGKPLGQLPQGSNAATQTHLGYLGAQARRLFVDNILKRVTNSLAADLRRKAASRLLFGDSAPFFALVGVSLASGSGILTRDDELEGVCWEIRVNNYNIIVSLLYFVLINLFIRKLYQNYNGQSRKTIEITKQ